MPYPIYEEGLPIELNSPQVNRGWSAGLNHDGFLGRRPASWAVQQGSNHGQPPLSRPASGLVTPGPRLTAFISATNPATTKRGMKISWARFDDNYDSNEKIMNAGRDAKDLHEVSIRWSCRLRTDGRVPKAALTELAVLAQLPGRKSIHRNAALRLVELNLWEEAGDVWNIHDFTDFGPPKRFVDHAPRGDNHETRGKYHAPRDPVPVPVPDPLEDFSKEVLSDEEGAA